MLHIKKLVMHGFKSFPTKTEIPFERNMNLIVGPNGSGKSNITDALCFVLGRLSIKSIRAAKAANLIFSGNKHKSASQEAIVELVFDNTDKTFTIESNEVIIKRMVRKNGQSVYKINNQTKTRQELLELLAQAGIDPYGFNIVLQGEIASFVKMGSEERRKVIEEVAGISIYETRKQKSLKELEKTDERLKEVSAVLRERGTYLKNLEKEKQEAENYKRFELTIKKCKATILSKKLAEKEKQITNTKEQIQHQEKEIEKIKNQIQEKNQKISKIEEQISKINKTIESSTNNEQETLHGEISELKQKEAGLKVRKENFENRLQEEKQKSQELEQKISELETQISKIKTTSPKIKKQQQELKKYQEHFDILEKKQRKFYLIKSELSTLENTKQEKQNTLIELKKEQEIIQKNISALFEEIKYEKSIEKSHLLKQKTSRELEQIKHQISEFEKKELEIEKQNAVLEQELEKNKRLKLDIVKLDICPLCKNKITQKHIKEVISNANQKIENWNQKHEKNISQKQQISEEINKLKQTFEKLETKSNEIEIDILQLKNAVSRKTQIKSNFQSQEKIKHELEQIIPKLNSLKKQFEELKNIEQEYDNTRLKLNEISFQDIDLDTEVTIKQRELERLKIENKACIRNFEGCEEESRKITNKLNQIKKILQEKEKQEQELYEKFQKLFSQKNELQDRQKAVETEIIGFQHTIRNHEEKINFAKIEKAKFDAEQDALKTEFKEFENFETIQQPIEQVHERLQKAQFKISNIGPVNLRSLEVYEKIKQQCVLIEEKVQTIEKEKEKILTIITQIDRTKKKSFMKTLIAVNEYFTRNFSQLSKKGEVFLELENKKNPFEGGLNIIIKVAKGKYFDITSLSGGEKTIVALSLIFAIQEYKPYHFYIFDEIDAALDKHNSELLAALIKKHIQSGQYIIITHNDTLINEASTLYGVSMQEGISKVISLKI